MGGLGIAFRRRTQYKKNVEKVEIDIYNSIRLSDGAVILLEDVLFEDRVVEAKITYGGTQTAAFAMQDLQTGSTYTLAKTNNGSYKAADNGLHKLPQYFLSGIDGLVHRWQSDGVYVNGTIRVTQERVTRAYALRLVCGSTYSTRFFYIDVYDSTGTNLLYSLKPALLNKETPGLWDEVNQKFYGMTSDTGTLTLG